MADLHELVTDPAALRAALDAGANPDARDAAGDTPLHASVWPGAMAAVELLVARGADLDAVNHRGVPVLHEAVRRERPAMARLLVERGARVDDHAGDDGSTALHWAAKFGETELVELLLARGARIDARDRSGRTPLDWALVRIGRDAARLTPTVHLLLSRGAPHEPEVAIRHGTREHLRPWMTRGKLSDGTSALGLAAAEGSPEVVRALLAAGAVARGEAFDMRSPLLRAIENGRADVIAILLDAGADPEWGGNEGALPLDAHVARLLVRGDRARADRIGELLVSHGARPTPQWAVLRESTYVLRSALGAGWHVDRPGIGGATALIAAARLPSVPMIEALLAEGADPRRADMTGWTPLHHAADGSITHRESARVTELLLAAGADPNPRDRHGRTPLHVALALVHTYGVNLDLVRHLVAAGADAGVRDDQGLLPLEQDKGGELHIDVANDLAGAEAVVGRRDAAVREVRKLLRFRGG